MKKKLKLFIADRSGANIHFAPFKFISLWILALVFILPNSIYSQCTNCPPASTYNGTFYASTTNLSGSHSCLAINGVYFVDANVAITTSAIFLGPNAEIRISSGATLSLNDCVISGCNEMWWRILVQSGGKLIAEDVDFQDAIEAIDARGNTEMIVKNCTFTNNYIGLHIRNKATGGGVLFSEPLFNNIFATNGQLLPPHAGQKGFAGISVENAAPVTVGAIGYPQNQFIDLTNGIISENSLVTVENALFQTPPSTNINTGMIGVLCDESEIHVNNSTFNNSHRGVSSSASDLFIEDNNYFVSNDIAVNVTNSLKRKIRVVGNFFTDTKVTGINADNNGGNFEEFTVEDNEIEIDYSPLPNFPGQFAVNLREAVTINQINASISGNFIELFGSRAAIDVTSNRTVDINDNDLEIYMFQPGNPFETHGIWLHDCGDLNVIGNSIIGTNTALTTGGNIHAFELENTDNSTICSNIADNTNAAFKFDGANPDTRFSFNEMGSHAYGLWLSSANGASYIGEQGVNNKARDNGWEIGSSYSGAAALNQNTSFFIFASRFHVRNTSQPQFPPSISTPLTPNSNWFDPFGGGVQPSCESAIEDTPQDTFSVLERSIADDTTPFTNYVDAQTFRAQTNFHRKLKNRPDLMGLNQAIDTFYSSMENGAVGAFYRISLDISQLGTPDAATEQNYANLENGITSSMDQLAGIDAQLLTATGSAKDALMGQRRLLTQEVDSLYAEKRLLDDALLVQRIAEADQLIALNASILTTTIPQQYQQTVNGIYLNTLAKGILTLSQSEISQLSAIANTCLYENGPAVSSARILLSIANGYQEYDEDLLCAPPSEYVSNNAPSNTTPVEHDEISLLPNPAIYQLEIRFPLLEDSGQLNIFNTNGVLKFSTDLGQLEDRHTVNLSGFAQGIYLVHVRANDRTLTKKLIVLE